MSFRVIAPRALVAAAALALLGATPASATPLRFTFSGGIVGSFLLDNTPAPASTTSVFRGAYTSGTGAFSTTPVVRGLNIALLPAGGGATVPVGQVLMDGPSALTMYGSGPLLTGTGLAPVFTRGRFALTAGSASGTPFTLTIASPGAPAPELGATWAAALAAAFALALTRRRAPATT